MPKCNQVTLLHMKYIITCAIKQVPNLVRRCQVVVGKNEQLKKWVAQLPVGVKGEVNGMPPLTPTDICAVWMTRRLSPDFIYKVC